MMQSKLVYRVFLTEADITDMITRKCLVVTYSLVVWMPRVGGKGLPKNDVDWIEAVGSDTDVI